MELTKVTYKEAREIWRITSCKISVESLMDAINSVLSSRAPEALTPVPEQVRFTLEEITQAAIKAWGTMHDQTSSGKVFVRGDFIEELCARLAPKPKTPEERVTCEKAEPNGYWLVKQDGKLMVERGFVFESDAKAFRVGLIAALKGAE